MIITIHKAICAFAGKADIPVSKLSLNDPNYSKEIGKSFVRSKILTANDEADFDREEIIRRYSIYD